MSLVTPLVKVGQWLIETGYRFVTPTPATHARVNARTHAGVAQSVEDIFGWSRPFAPTLLPTDVLELLKEAGVLETRGALLSTTIRFSSLDRWLFIHSSFPTLDPDAVFFGPDTYRFASLITQALAAEPIAPNARILDVGCGTGAGAVVAFGATVNPTALILSDVNPKALQYAQINATLAGVEASFRQCDLFAGIGEPLDLIVANPPYLVDAEARLYRNGGGALGSRLSVRIVTECWPHLAPGGRLVLYTGSAIVRGRDLLREAIEEKTRGAPVSYSYTELDPDVFGEELDMPAYAEADRIAVVGVVLTKRPTHSSAASGARSTDVSR